MHNRRSACIESKEKAAAAQFVPETETYSEESEETLIEEETVSETASETAPIVKPVGTTAPVERAAPAIPKKLTQPKPSITPTKLLNVPFIDQRKNIPQAVKASLRLWHFNTSVYLFRPKPL